MQKIIKVIFLKKWFLKIATAFKNHNVCCVSLSCEMKTILTDRKVDALLQNKENLLSVVQPHEGLHVSLPVGIGNY